MATFFVIDPHAMTIAEDTLVRSEDGILTFDATGSVGSDLAHKSRAAAEAMLAQMIQDREEEAQKAAQAGEGVDAFRTAFRNFRASKEV